jgi:hypothetical protein
VILAGFVGFSGLGGGLAILSGIDKFPIIWLQNTPFSNFTIPAIVLAAVGASSLGAALILFLDRDLGTLVSAVAGLVMVSWILAEIALINAPKPSSIEVLFLVIGLVQFGLGTYLVRSTRSIENLQKVPKEVAS